MNVTLHRGLRVGLGIRGIVGAIFLGFICLFQPLFGKSESFLWAKILLVLAALVYVVFSLIWDRRMIQVTNIQLLIAFIFVGLSLITESAAFLALGLFSHAMWDLWHLAREKRYVPWWYAGACVYVDIAAAILILMNY